MNAIPTKYAGVQFRSRLEAKWAAFFDLVGWKWEYEPFDCAGYIPDFVLCGRMLVEVKPIVWRSPLSSMDEQMFNDAKRKIEAAAPDGRFCCLAILGTEIYEYGPACALSGKGAERRILDADGKLGGWEWRDLSLDYWPSHNEASFFGQPILGAHPSPPPQRGERYFTARWREAGNRVQWRGVESRP